MTFRVQIARIMLLFGLTLILHGKHRLVLGRFTRINRDNRVLPYLSTPYPALAASDGRYGSRRDRVSSIRRRKCTLAYSDFRFRPDNL